jgi:polynucleotide 5'-hydroxyl-kinase GRC3/NOL9
LAELQVSRAWRAAADRLCEGPWRRLVVLGACDRGKSTFCRYLAARLAAGGDVAVLDCDLGQKLVGRPACVTLGRAAGGAIFLDRLRFIGETNPTLSLAGVVAAAARLARTAGPGRLVVNTSGLIAGPGLTLKRWKLEALDPDWILGLAIDDELEPLLAPLPQARVLRIPPSAAAVRKGDALRSAARISALAAALTGATRQALSSKVVMEELQREPPPGPRLCGLADFAGEDLGLGIIDLKDPDWVNTPVDAGCVRRVRIGMAAPPPLLNPAPSPGAARP